MPKKPRSAHVPRQATRKRKAAPRRGEVSTGADAYLDLSGPVTIPGVTFGGPVAPIPMPSGPARQARPAAAAVAPRASRLSGQLPTFERSYLVEELRRIGTTAGALLMLIGVLTIILR